MTNPSSMTQVLAQIHAIEVRQGFARSRRAARRRGRADARPRIKGWWEAQLRRRRNHLVAAACPPAR